MDVNDLMRQRQGRPINVLVVDDEEKIRDLFRDFCLSSSFFQVETVSGGHEAIERIEKDDFDIITIDLVMPEISGLETIAAIRKIKPHLPVVIITGNATDNLIREAGRIGGCRVMHKPIGVKDFLEELIDIAREKCR